MSRSPRPVLRKKAETLTPPRKIARLALLLASAMILSYAESLLPPVAAIPGIKIGLANTITLFALYLLGAPAALLLSLLRVLLSSLLFGNAASMLFSLSGALLSFLGMFLVKKTEWFSPIGVSVAGGVLHNAGQVLTACAILGTAGILTLLPPLLFSGTVTGVAVGILAGLMIRKLAPRLGVPLSEPTEPEAEPKTPPEAQAHVKPDVQAATQSNAQAEAQTHAQTTASEQKKAGT